MKNTYFFILFIAFSAILQAQKALPIDTTYRAQVQLKAAYIGTLVYPGFCLELDYPLRTVKKEVRKENVGIIRRRFKEQYVSGQLLMYYHPNLHSNWMLTAHWTARQQMRGGFYSDLRFGFGGARTFFTDPVYEVDAQGQAHRRYGAGNFYAVGTFDFALGYNLAPTQRGEWAFFVRPGFLFLFPFNTFAYLRPYIAVGAAYRIGKYWPSHPKYKEKSRNHRPLFKFGKKS